MDDRIDVSSIAICVATYRRNDDLTRLLSSIGTSLQAFEKWPRVLVVDNNPEADAAQAVHRFAFVDYFHEPEPGIVAARNRALREIGEKCSAVIFLDDDEWVSSTWFIEIVAAAERNGADVTWGPVESVLPSDSADHKRLHGLIQRRSHPDGAVLEWAATNNVLIRRTGLGRLEEPWFSPEFSVTGGSDAELFWRLRRAGGTIAWAERAVVYEDVPPERATLHWAWRRTIRYGNVSARLLMRDRPRAAVAAIGAARVAVGLSCLALDLIRRPRLSRRGFEHTAKGVGMLGAALDLNVQEYARQGK